MATTPQPIPKRPGQNGFAYKPQFALILPCKDEAEQQRLFSQLCKQGYAPKVVCV